MFTPEGPIKTEQDDFLGRKKFSQNLGNALLDWKEKESLVIAIYGEWGSGKSSVINLTSKNIKESNSDTKPTIIEFNPWAFSGENNLSKHFFNEIAKELEIKNDANKDIETAQKLRLCASRLSLAPDKTLLTSLSSKFLFILGLLGITGSQIINWFNILSPWVQNIFFVGGFLLLLLEFFKEYLVKLANFFEKKAEYYSKSVLEIKQEIKKDLADREKKLVIIIDDIDRLNQSEIRQIFRLIRVNADFPNTIYLLAFDRKIVEKSLTEPSGVSGKDYLSKIVQVNFDLPFANPSKISDFLIKELNRISSTLPKSKQKHYAPDDPYWQYVYHSGFIDLFKNIRDVKRFVSSLRFNISQMYPDKVMDVNTTDFTAVEAIRVFAPDFYSFMKGKSVLFTSTDWIAENATDGEQRKKKEIENALAELPAEIKNSVLELIKSLFPHISDIFQNGYSYGHGGKSIWRSNLRVCTTNNFDRYFTMISSGDENGLRQIQIEEILSKINSAEDLEQILRQYIEKKKIRNVLQSIQNYTSDEEYIPQDNIKNVVKAFFNIYDDLPEEEIEMWGFGVHRSLIAVIYQLFKRESKQESDKNKDLEILKEAIPLSKSMSVPVRIVYIESSNKEKGRELIVPEDKIDELQKLCAEKIKGADINTLLQNKELDLILHCWKEWDEECKWKEFIKEVGKDNQKLLALIANFVTEVRLPRYNDIVTEERFDYKDMSNFLNLEQLKVRLEKIKKQDDDLYKNHLETIDLFLDNFDKQDPYHLD